MAKMKVHELAKELDKQSKELIAFLKEKGMDVKAAQSSIEDDAITLVKNHFGKKEMAEAPAKTETKEEKSMTKAAETANDETVSNEAPKKKKKIIFVSNPHNSKISGQPGQRSSQNNERKQQTSSSGNNQRQGSNQRQGYNQRQGTPVRQDRQQAPYRPIKPLTPPSPTPPVTMVPSTNNIPRRAVNLENKSLQKPEETTAGNVSGAPAQGNQPENIRPETVETQRKPENRSDSRTDNRSDSRIDNRTDSRTDSRNNNYNGRSDNRNDNRRPEGQNYRPDGQNRRPEGTNYRSDGQNRRPEGTNYRSGGQTGQRPEGTGYRSDGQNRRPEGPNYRPDGQNRRPEGTNYRSGGQTSQRPEGTGYRSDGQNRRPDGQNRRPFENNQGDRRGSFGGQNNNRFTGNNDRNNRGTGGQDNKFRKPAPGKGFVPESPVKDQEKHRDEEKRRIGQEKDKRSKRDMIYEDDDAKLKNKAGRFIKPEKKEEEAQEQIKVITIPDSLTIKELADTMKLQPSVIIKKLFLQGQIVTVNSELTYEEAENIAIEYDIICEKEEKVDIIEELLKEEDEIEEEMTKRPPVICVMGHVDHGKTSLLDAIRKTNVTDKEAGGITQHIGAYTVNAGGQKITFLDTPGHEAFTAMRMRGANSTDIAILVVAADDGVMPQTVEAINHAKAAGIEIIVAVNKVDKPNANIDRVKQEMTEYELIPVDWGGTTEFVPVSAKSGEGIDTLLETILLTAEILELKANPKRRARGLVIEAELDKGRGPVATVLVQKGTLCVGDFISAGACHGKVRAMIDDKGRRVKEALPSTPVEILGLSDVPSAGEVFIAHENDKTAKSYAETYLAQNKERMLEDTKAKMSLDDLFTQIQAGNLKELNLIIKADVQGSVEAVKQSLLKLSNEEVVVKCIHGGVGAINESDVSLASASAAIIIGFNVRPDAMAKTIAEREGVDIRLYKVIYQAIEDVEAAMKGMLDPVFEEKVIGHAEVRQIFKASAVGNIAGSYVLDGIFQRDCKVRITREGEQIFEGGLASLKRFKDDVKEVKAGFECGFVFEDFDQMQELDIVEAYIMVEVPR